jgi:hypothetical protein
MNSTSTTLIVLTVVVLTIFICIVCIGIGQRAESNNPPSNKTDTITTEPNPEIHYITPEVMQVFDHAQIDYSDTVGEKSYLYTYQSMYNYGSMRKVEQHMFEFMTELQNRYGEAALRNITIYHKTKHREDGVSPILTTLIQDSWLSASEPALSYMLDMQNTNRIIIDICVPARYMKEYDYPTEYEVGELIIEYRIRWSTPTSTTTIHIIGRGPIRVVSDDVSLVKSKSKSDKPYLFYYWDNINSIHNNHTPSIISLCHQTMEKQKSFNVIKLDSSNIYSYLPELKPYKMLFEPLKLAHRVDIYRVFLLYKYGGLYLDADIIVMRDPIETIKPLEQFEYVGFGCTGYKCEADGYSQPSNSIMASRRGSYVMRDTGEAILRVLMLTYTDGSTIGTVLGKNYFMIGKHIIWYIMDKHTKTDAGYSYHQMNSNLIGTRDADGLWVSNIRLFSNKPINYKSESDLLFVVFYNSTIGSIVTDMDKFRSIDPDILLNTDMEISRFLRKALL